MSGSEKVHDYMALMLTTTKYLMCQLVSNKLNNTLCYMAYAFLQ